MGAVVLSCGAGGSHQDHRPKESQGVVQVSATGRCRVDESSLLSCLSARLCEDRLNMKCVMFEGLSGMV